MKLRITAKHSTSKLRKEITFEIPEDVAEYFAEQFRKHHIGEDTETKVEGNAAMKISLTLLNNEAQF